MMRRIMRVAGIGIVLGAMSVALWGLAVPMEDPRSLGYALWKAGAIGYGDADLHRCWILDKDRDDLVRGLDAAQLRRRFGVLRSRADATANQRYYNETDLAGEYVFWIGDTQWAVVMDRDVGKSLRLMKG